MKDLSQSSEQGNSSPFTLLDRASVTRWAPIPLRLIVGYGFMQHGFAKLSSGPDVFAVVLHSIGVPAPHLMAWLTTLIEIFGGVAVLLGFLSRSLVCRWLQFSLSRCLPFIYLMDSVRSN